MNLVNLIVVCSLAHTPTNQTLLYQMAQTAEQSQTYIDDLTTRKVYDPPRLQEAASITRAHVDLLRTVLDAYAKSARAEGDDDLADRWANLAERATFDNWCIDHPWLDRSPRFVPVEAIRAELFELIDRHNTLRYQTELEILADRMLDVLRQKKRTQKQHYLAVVESGLDIDRDTSDRVLEHLHEQGIMARSGTSGHSKWWVKE
jgi:hypothetical protein